MADQRSAAWSLAVDFGTSNTAATVTDSTTGQVQPVRLSPQGSTMPSGVLLEGGGLVVGVPAVRRSTITPEAYEPHPKRRMGEGAVLLGEDEVLVVDLVAAVLRKVLDEASRVAPGGPLQQVWLTHPERWPTQRKDELAAAAVRAGVPRPAVTLLSESVAAAQHYAITRPVPDGALVAVVDVGAGTCDTALLRAGADGLHVLASHGDSALGGLDFDERLRRWVLDQLAIRGRGDVLEALERSPADRLTLRDQVQYAKEELSEFPSATLRVGNPPVALTITRAEFETLIAEDADRIAALAQRTVRDGVPPGDRLHALYLTGGASLVPLIQQRLQAATGIAAETLDDPKLVVAMGAQRTPRSSAPGPGPLTPKRPWVRVVLTGAAALAVLGGVIAVARTGGDAENANGGGPTTTTEDPGPTTADPRPLTEDPGPTTEDPGPTTEEPAIPVSWTPYDSDGDGYRESVARAYGANGVEWVSDTDRDGQADDAWHVDYTFDGAVDVFVYLATDGFYYGQQGDGAGGFEAPYRYTSPAELQRYVPRAYSALTGS